MFTYGSLMFPEVWTRVVAGDYRAVVGSLEHHARFAIDGETYPGVVARSDVRVDGVLYLDVSDDDVARLDAFEGDDYLRGRVEIACSDGTVRPAEVYVYRLVDRLLPSPWEPESFAMQRFMETYLRDRLDR